MLGQLLTAIAMVGLIIGITAQPAWAGDPGGQNSSSSSSATAAGGTITISAGHTTWTPPKGSHWAKAESKTDPPGKPNPNQPYGCTYTVPPAWTQKLIGVGGPTPGEWVLPMCAGPGTIDPMPAIWVTHPRTVVQVSPVQVAQWATSRLPLLSPTIEMAPPANRNQLVNVATWLWISRTAWKALSGTARAGPVAATATAEPAEVVWNMGDGRSVTCRGPGTPYDSSHPNARTDCSYTWTQSSAGQPGGVYEVTATVYWRVSWTVVGAPGGGTLGLVRGPSSRVAVRVVESQAINNVGSGS